MQRVCPIEAFIREGIENVEPTDPGGHARGEGHEQPPRPAPCPRYREVAANRCDPQARPEHEVRPPRKALRIAVAQHPCERERREIEAQRVESGRADEKDGNGYDDG